MDSNVSSRVVIAHRGASAYAPENTIASFEKARDLGCSCIEFDVALNHDNDLFVFHDDLLYRTTNGTGEMANATTQYLKSLDAGAWFLEKFKGIEIPTFREAIHWFNSQDIQANIEIKPIQDAIYKTTLAVLYEIDNYWAKDKKLPLISSFNYESLLICYKENPQLKLGLLLNSWPDNWLELARKINCYSINLNKKIATRKRIKDIIANGYKVYIFTVNNRLMANIYFKLKVDAIFSDYPDLLTNKWFGSRFSVKQKDNEVGVKP